MISIVVPIFNEAENIPHLLRAIHENLVTNYEVLFVDDRSEDGSARVALSYPDFPVRVIQRAGTRDLALSVLEGIAAAQGRYVVVMDGDFSHDPASILPMIFRLRAGARFVVGSRFHPSATMVLARHRRVIAWVGKRLSTGLSASSDPFSGFFALRRSDLPVIPVRTMGFKIGLEIQVRGSFAAVDIPISFQPRRWGFSKVNLRQIYRVVKHLTCLHWLKHRTSPVASANISQSHGGNP